MRRWRAVNLLRQLRICMANSHEHELPVRGREWVQWRTPILSPRQGGKFEIIGIDESNYITMSMSKSPQKLILRMKLDEKSWKKLFWADELHQTLIIFISLITNIWISRPARVTGWRPWWRCPWWCWWQCWIGDWTHFPSLTMLPNSNQPTLGVIKFFVII